MKYSIIITTHGNHLEDYLKPCIESIVKYSYLDAAEIIVVANGCPESVRAYVGSLGGSVRLVWYEEGIGYTKAANAGLRVATGQYIVLLNDDTKLLEQPKNQWLDMLRTPLERDDKVGITGPVKFTWDCGGIIRTAMAFWCVMIRRRLFCELGFLDEVFNPGMGEDGDFCIRAELVGYKLVQVPVDGSKIFGQGVSDEKFPIFHKGNGTFAEAEQMKNEVIKRNNKILEKKYASRLEKIYNSCLSHECDINQLFPVLRKYAVRCEHITEFGVRGVFSTYALLAATPIKMRSYDIEYSSNITEALDVAKEQGIDFKFLNENVLDTEIEFTDLLFIDTLHTYSQLSMELKRHGNFVRKYILIHDTDTWGERDEIDQGSSKTGMKTAVREFLLENPQWRLKQEIKESNGLTILERRPQYTIVIPTHNRQADLKKCLDSVFENTYTVNKEVFVIPNGCMDGTLEYLDTIRKRIRILNIPQEVGQVIPAKEGVKRAKGDFVILLDDDCVLLPQQKDTWIRMLQEPFQRPEVGITGVFGAEYPYLGQAMHNGCTMFKKSLVERVGPFDEEFGFGYLYDTDFSLRARKEGYEVITVGRNGDFPIYHPDSPVTSETKTQRAPLIRKNREILYRRHGMKPKYSIVIPTYNHLEDCLKPCLESIKQHTHLENVEIIVVANGCKDETDKYVDSLGYPFKLLWFDEGLGFTRATNEGIKVAQGEYVILLNNDTVLLEKGYSKGTWIQMLEEPFIQDEKVGITGPLKLFDDYANHEVLIFFCVMMKKKLFDELGLLDEIFSPGGGEDIDFCMKAVRAGYKQVMVPGESIKMTFTNEGQFPIYHKGEGTFSNEEWPEYGNKIIKDNGLVNMLRYNKHIKLNVGSGGVEVPGYVSVDKNDMRASLVMDVFDLDKHFPQNSVEEILASHLFEHVNPYESVDLLRRWNFMLKPGGKLIMELPNIEELCKDFVTASKAERYGILNCIYGAVNTRDNDNKKEITSPHLWGWYPEMMEEHLKWAGFTNIVFGPEQIPHPHKNFRVEAEKPLYFRDALDKVVYDVVQPGESVLDLGCGDKSRTMNLIRDNEVLSVDAWEKCNPDMVLDVEKEELPFKENSFDTVLMLDFVEHLEKERGEKIIERAKRIAKKKVLVFTPKYWTDNKDNVANPELWCYQNDYDLHKSLWHEEDFRGWATVPYPDSNVFVKLWSKV